MRAATLVVVIAAVLCALPSDCQLQERATPLFASHELVPEELAPSLADDARSSASTLLKTRYAAHAHSHALSRLNVKALSKVSTGDVVHLVDAAHYPDVGDIVGDVDNVHVNAETGVTMITGFVRDASSGRRSQFHVMLGADGVHSGSVTLADHDAALRFDGEVTQRVHIDAHICSDIPTVEDDGSYDPEADHVVTRVLSTPSYTSNPSASHAILLDFDGYDASSSAWSGVGVAGPYDIDGDTNTFSATELARIEEIWMRMAEDFAPFDIALTTDVSFWSPLPWSSKSVCAFTITDAWREGAGGVAYVGVFAYNSATYQPAWVFPSRLGGGSAYFCAEAGSHEVGHNLGLSHDGTSSVGYYTGHGSGDTGWAPIMGVGYYKPLVQWSKGEYADANQQQDDLAIISGSSNGFGYRADDHVNSNSGAATVLQTGSSPAGAGVIETSSDIDVFMFTATASGTFTVSVTGASPSSNLDIEARLYAGTSSLVQTNNPSTLISASVSTSGVPGTTYYIQITGVGKSPVSGDGYSDYGSLGQYELTYSGPAVGGAVCGNSIVESGEECESGACCNTATCQFYTSGTQCRASAGVCDIAETCTGTSNACPADALRPSSYQCRASAGACDNAETCTGASTSCPADTFKSSGTQCRASAGVCDVAETCTGSSASCPADAFRSASTVCRAASGQCDAEETCTGSSASCPADGFLPSGTACNDGDACTSPDTCNGANVCTGPTICSCGNGVVDPGEACDDGNLLNGDCCSSTCQIESAGTVCRPSAGPCDVAETCTGSSDTCPANTLRPSGYECRASAGICDVPETCSGSSASCPTDAFVTSGTQCRASAGVCDVAETCTGSSASCPTNAFRSSTVECRASFGLCDAAEFCTGSSATCPADGFLPAGTSCDNGQSCDDGPDTCNGAGLCEGPNPQNCNSVCGDGVVEGLEECDDGNTDDGDCCSSTCMLDTPGTTCAGTTCDGTCSSVGVCEYAIGCCLSDSQCDDGSVCTTDTCVGGLCEHAIVQGTACDDLNSCTDSDTCNAQGVCIGINECATDCGENGFCCHGQCECSFGFEPPLCTGGPITLSLNQGVRDVISATSQGHAFVVTKVAGDPLFIVIEAVQGGATRAPTRVHAYAGYGQIPERTAGNVINSYEAVDDAASKQVMEIDPSEEGDLYVSVYRVSATDANYIITAAPTGDISSQSTVSPSPAVTDGPMLWVIVGGAVLLVLLVVIAVVVLRKRSSSSTPDIVGSGYKGTELVDMSTKESDLTINVVNPAPAPLFSAPLAAPTAPSPAAAPRPRPAATKRAVALYAFVGRAADELSFAQGDQITVIEEFDDGWARGRMGAREGVFPISYVTIQAAQAANKPAVVAKPPVAAKPAARARPVPGGGRPKPAGGRPKPAGGRPKPAGGRPKPAGARPVPGGGRPKPRW